ncbi:MAG: hypothetical protein RR376_23145, partial [Janthinobacterium sp.]
MARKIRQSRRKNLIQRNNAMAPASQYALVTDAPARKDGGRWRSGRRNHALQKYNRGMQLSRFSPI